MAFKIYKIKHFLITAIFVGIFCLSFPRESFCINDGNILHIPPSATSFKTSGLPMILQAKLSGTRNVNHKIRLIAVIDGDVLDVPSNQVYWDAQDRPVYDFNVYYPKRSISYRFVIDTYSDLNSSKRFVSGTYSIYRACKIQTESNEKNILQKASEESLIAERNVKVREEIIKVIKEIQEKAEL